MKLARMLFAILLAAGLTGVATSHSVAQTLNPNLLLMVQDDDTDTVAESRQRIMSRVRQAINNSMSATGYNMYDPTAVSQDFLMPTDRRKARQALIEIARAIPQPPIDAAILMKLYASAERSNYSDFYRLAIRVEGDVLNVQSGQVIGGFEAAAHEKPTLPLNCDQDCILEEVGKHSRVLGMDLARAIDIQIKGYLKSTGVSSRQPKTALKPAAPATPMPNNNAGVPQAPAASGNCEGFPHSYTISFIGFNNNEHAQIEEFLDSFECKYQMRTLPSSPSKLGFWYETSARDIVLRRNLRTMLEWMQVENQFNFSGTRIEITKIQSR